jgi:nucleotide-binding universal stress UspA family protein
MILICYDGSPDAEAAIDHTAALLGGRPAIVLTVWEPLADVMARTGAGLAYSSPTVDYAEVDRASEDAARARAEEGAERARRAGLEAQPRTAERGGTVSQTILATAEELGADVIVMGTRGLTGLKSLFLGSVSRGVLQHADRPVIVVPSPTGADAE